MTAPQVQGQAELTASINRAADIERRPEHYRAVLASLLAGKRVLAADAATVTGALLDVVLDARWMATRYADGRSTYAPGEINRGTRLLLALGAQITPDPITGSVWARDGMYGLVETDGVTP